MKRILLLIIGLAFCLSAAAQADKQDVRAGNRDFRRGQYRQSDIDYRKALVKDSTSFAAHYDLASNLYRQAKYQEAAGELSKLKDVAADSQYADRYYFNSGDVALQSKDYASAVEAFKQALLRNPGDLEAKENYIYAKKMLENQQNQDQQNQDQNQDGDSDQNQDQQNQDQNQNNQDQQDQQDQNNDQNKDQNKDQNQDQNKQNQPQGEPQISQQQAQQMLNAIQAKEKETQDKVNKEKAAVLESRQKDKNW